MKIEVDESFIEWVRDHEYMPSSDKGIEDYINEVLLHYRLSWSEDGESQGPIQKPNA